MIEQNFTHKFPPRKIQLTAFNWIEESFKHYNDLVLELPTGAGKSAIGTTLQVYLGSGYYLVTEKSLQDQLINDVNKGLLQLTLKDIRSATNYSCPTFQYCMTGAIGNTRREKKKGSCPYKIRKDIWQKADYRLTNYAYLFASGYASDGDPKQVLIADEAHNLEEEPTNQLTLSISQKHLDTLELGLVFQRFTSLENAIDWLIDQYAPSLLYEIEQLELKDRDGETLTNHENIWLTKLLAALSKMQMVVMALEESKAEDWIGYETFLDNQVAWCIKPLEAGPLARPYFTNRAKKRIFMSAFIGDKTLFCKTMGLDPDKTAWLTVPSEFSIEKRPVIVCSIGSMGKKNQEYTLGPMIDSLIDLLTHHSEEKGLLHCNSYALGKLIYQGLKEKAPDLIGRLLWSSDSRDKKKLLDIHHLSTKPTVLLSPSLTEGYDFKDDLARWQAILKMPFPHLGDPWIWAKKSRSEAWYAQETLKTIVQAAGRICRHKEDYGVTYILDSDFDFLYDKYNYLLPEWFINSLSKA